MKQFLNTLTEKFFTLSVGTILLAIIIVSMQIALNFGQSIPQKTISMGWIMVSIWVSLLCVLSIFHISKNTENNE